MSNTDNTATRDAWGSKWGFVLACVGSAVGMGNVWLFPTRVSAYGGGSFILPYVIFVIIIGFSGVIGEMSLGRATRNGPIGAFAAAVETRGIKRDIGRLIGAIPMLGALALAVGYSIVVGWIVKYTWMSFTGDLLAPGSIDGFGAAFGATAPEAHSLFESISLVLSGQGNTFWQIIALIMCFFVMVGGVAKGIEVMNKFMMPLFFLMFAGLAIYMFFQPGAHAGYHYIFRIDPEFIAKPMTWVFALGQAFFSLSLAGNGTVIYGSYLDEKIDVVEAAWQIALMSIIAALLASLVVIPAMATTGQALTQGGPGLLFIFLPSVFAGMPGGYFVAIVFFVAVLFAGMTSLVNLYEAPIASLQDELGFSRAKAVAIIAIFGTIVSLSIQGIVAGWMDFVSIIVCPFGALLASIMFGWFMGKKRIEEEVSKGRKHPIGSWFAPMYRYLFVFLTATVWLLGLVFGGIG